MARSYHGPKGHSTGSSGARRGGILVDMFRRGSKPTQSAADAERQALFEKLAQRPESVCPFLGLAAARAEFEPQATDEHRCYAFGEPEPLSGEQQRNVCLQLGYANCPRYLRGVLVIPTDELEALRRPPQRIPPHRLRPPPHRSPTGTAAGSSPPCSSCCSSSAVVSAPGGCWPDPARWPWCPTPTPKPSVAPSAAPSGSAEESLVREPTPLIRRPAPGDEFIGYEVTVTPGDYLVFRVNGAGRDRRRGRRHLLRM